MSADDYLRIEPNGNKYVLYRGVASNDYRRKIGEFETLEKAIEKANEDPAEYGLSIATKPKEN